MRAGSRAAMPLRPLRRSRRLDHGFRYQWRRRWRRRSPPPVLPQAQDLPLLGGERAEDRLQGYEAALALHLGARQDRALADHGGLGQEAARALDRDQARPLSRALALRDPVASPLPQGGRDRVDAAAPTG